MEFSPWITAVVMSALWLVGSFVCEEDAMRFGFRCCTVVNLIVAAIFYVIF